MQGLTCAGTGGEPGRTAQPRSAASCLLLQEPSPRPTWLNPRLDIYIRRWGRGRRGRAAPQGRAAPGPAALRPRGDGPGRERPGQHRPCHRRHPVRAPGGSAARPRPSHRPPGPAGMGQARPGPASRSARCAGPRGRHRTGRHRTGRATRGRHRTGRATRGRHRTGRHRTARPAGAAAPNPAAEFRCRCPPALCPSALSEHSPTPFLSKWTPFCVSSQCHVPVQYKSVSPHSS
ncbi:uncharacterized protein C10orf95-like [Ammospiza nelsoni]|uniref:uncharacterized protein C10orf95-like n=1 Tax=Ammospiza nelsoni TaxID=2857394 RepID=UPI002869957B|nr:uncharacterized protein C10orf95-like [Ammospiza nelsoni]